MGREARTSKDRKCNTCKETFYYTAEQLKAHSLICVRASALGLVIPHIERPTLQDLVAGRATRGG